MLFLNFNCPPSHALFLGTQVAAGPCSIEHGLNRQEHLKVLTLLFKAHSEHQRPASDLQNKKKRSFSFVKTKPLKKKITLCLLVNANWVTCSSSLNVCHPAISADLSRYQEVATHQLGCSRKTLFGKLLSFCIKILTAVQHF